jgi:predicted enzyme related to lactoylglutathione lyase
VTGYATFLLDSAAQVDDAARRIAPLSGRVLKGPYPTYYGQWQVVAADPEGHVFRLSATELPAGVSAPPLPSGPPSPAA